MYDDTILPVLEPHIHLTPPTDHPLVFHFRHVSKTAVSPSSPSLNEHPHLFDLDMNLHSYENSGDHLIKLPKRPDGMRGIRIDILFF